MQFQAPLIHGKLIQRYKRFLADIELDNGEIVVAHTTNSGSMKSCIIPGAQVYLSVASDPKRKTKFTWEMILIDENWVGINTSWPNIIAVEAIRNNDIEQLQGYHLIKREVTFGDSRFDIYCENEFEKCFVEVKNVTLKMGDFARFPDAVTERGQKHLNTLIDVKQSGYRAVMLYIIQRIDVTCFGPAYDIDPEYAKALKTALEHGVEVIALQAMVSPTGINITRQIPLVL